MVEDGVEIGVTEMRVDLSLLSYTGGGQLERIDSPGEVLVLIDSSKRSSSDES